jgi:hypothetical protein
MPSRGSSRGAVGSACQYEIKCGANVLYIDIIPPPPRDTWFLHLSKALSPWLQERPKAGLLARTQGPH